MSTRRARVTVAYATVKLLDPATGKWTVAGFYRDAVLPIEADPENVASLVRREYAEWLDSGEAGDVQKQEDDAVKAQEEAAQKRTDESEAAGPAADKAAGVTDDADEDDDAPRPGGNASRDDWAAYAESKGAAKDETRPVDQGGLSRDDLRLKYGTS